MSERHHYVAQSYLRQFVAPPDEPHHEPSPWCANLQDGSIFRRAPRKLANRRDYHAIRVDGEVHYDVERMFSEIESDGAPLLKRLQAGQIEFSDDEVGCLVRLAVLHRHRVPVHREMFANWRQKAAEAVTSMLRSDRAAFIKAVLESGAGDLERAESAWAFVRDPSKYSIVIPPEKSLQDSLEMMEATGDICARMHWHLLVSDADDALFLTSDHPTKVYNPSASFALGHGLGAPRAEVTFPLTPRVGLLGAWANLGKVLRVPPSCVTNLNRRTLANSQVALCSTRALAEWAVQQRTTATEMWNGAEE